MAFLGKKKARAEEPSAGDSKRRLRENERLRSVIKESTYGAAIEILNRNIRFRLTPDPQNNPRHLTLLMHADAIGGLNEKTKRDEAKGSLVQQILSDQIEAIALGEMLEREFIAFVPSQGTLQLLGEYEMMTQAQYYWAVFTTVDGELALDQNIGPARFDQAVAIQAGASIKEVIEEGGADGEATWSRIAAGGVAIDDEEDEVFGATAMSQVEALEDVSVEEVAESVTSVHTHSAGETSDAGAVAGEPLDVEDAGSYYAGLDFTEDDADDSDDSADYAEEIDPALISEASVEVAHGVHGGNGDTSYASYVAHNEGREFTEDQMRDTIARRFLSEDLDLTVDMAEFELSFGSLDTPRVNVSDVLPADSGDWLGAQVAQTAQVANAELAALRQRHDAQLSQLYVDYTSRHIQSVIKEVSLVDPDSKFGRMMALCDSDRDEANANIYQASSARRKAVEDRFNEEADAVAEAAAQQARVTHMNMNRGRREAALGQINTDIAQEIEGRYEAGRQQVLRLRRHDADLGLQQGKTLIFEELMSMHKELLSVEDAHLQQWNQRLLTLIDDNRKADIARAEVLSEELKRESIVEQARREHADRVSQIRSDHEARVRELEDRITQAQQEAVTQLASKESFWKRQLEEATDDVKRTNGLLDELNRQMEGMSASIHQQYVDRIDTLTTSRDQYAQDVVRTAEAAKRTHRAAISLMALLAGAALAVGLVAGWALWQVPDQPNETSAGGVVVEAPAES